VVPRRPGQVLRAYRGDIAALSPPALSVAAAAAVPCRPAPVAIHRDWALCVSAPTHLTSAVEEDKRCGEVPARAEVAGETAPNPTIELPPSHLVDLRPQVAGAGAPALQCAVHPPRTACKLGPSSGRRSAITARSSSLSLTLWYFSCTPGLDPAWQ